MKRINWKIFGTKKKTLFGENRIYFFVVSFQSYTFSKTIKKIIIRKERNSTETSLLNTVHIQLIGIAICGVSLLRLSTYGYYSGSFKMMYLCFIDNYKTLQKLFELGQQLRHLSIIKLSRVKMFM